MANAKSLGLRSYDSIFTTEDERQEQQGQQERVIRMPLSEMHYFKNHPYKVLDNAEMMDTVESVKAHGVLVPCLIRPDPQGGYEIVSGHRRHRASELAGISDLPVIVREMDNDTATIIMVDANIQRENLLPSEKAKAYRMKLEAMKRQAGRPLKNSVQVGQNLIGTISRERLAKDSGDSSVQIHRYIRLTYLLPELLDMVDEKKLAFTPAVDVSYLNDEEQSWLLEIMQRDECAPSGKQAKQLKLYSSQGTLTQTVIEAVLSAERPEERKVMLDGSKIKKYVPSDYTPKQTQDLILRLLENWHRQQQRSQKEHAR